MQNGVGRFRKNRALVRAATWTDRSTSGERVEAVDGDPPPVLAGAQALRTRHNPITP
jgi:hypothetical protein